MLGQRTRKKKDFDLSAKITEFARCYLSRKFDVKTEVAGLEEPIDVIERILAEKQLV